MAAITPSGATGPDDKPRSSVTEAGPATAEVAEAEQEAAGFEVAAVEVAFVAGAEGVVVAGK